jgi:hypothetical protein
MWTTLAAALDGAGCHSYLASKPLEARAVAPVLDFSFIVLLGWPKVAPHVILKACFEGTKEKRS